MKLQEDINEQSLLNPELINYLPFLYSHQFVLFVCFFHLASPFISSSLQQMDAGLNFHLALVVLSSWAFECYLAYCQRDSGKTKARNAIWQIHTFIGCSLEEVSWECRESYDAEAWLLCWMVKSLLRWRWKPSLNISISCHYFSPHVVPNHIRFFLQWIQPYIIRIC